MAVVKANNLTIRPVPGSPGTYYASWTWSVANQLGYMDHLEIWWTYYTAGGVSFVGEQKNVDPSGSEAVHPQYTPPSNAVSFNFWIKPISKTYEKTENIVNKKGKVTSTRTIVKNYITVAPASVNYYITPVPDKPSEPTVTIDKNRLTAELNTYDTNTSYVQFQVVKDDTTVVSTGISAVTTSHAAYTCTVSLGGNYKVRARGRGPGNAKTFGGWSEYSSNSGTIPSTPSKITKHSVLTESSVQLYWSAVANATAYDIEYTVNKSYFDVSDNVQTVTTDTGVTSRIISNLESGQTWFFRIRATNSVGKSGWSSIYSILLGKIPAAPTTWSDATAIVADSYADLYWMHNSEDGSSQTAAQIEITVKGKTSVITLAGDDILSEIGVASRYRFDAGNVVIDPILDLSDFNILDSDGNQIASKIVDYYDEGTILEWRVRTKGVLSTPNSGYGEWSTKRTIIIYGTPAIELEVSNEPDYSSILDLLTEYPIYIRAVAYPQTQSAVGWNVKITSNQAYITEDHVGRLVRIGEGAEVYSKYFPATSNEFLLNLSAGDVDLESTRSYTITVDVALSSGLRTSSSLSFDVEWGDNIYIPDAEVSIDDTAYLAYISPFCTDSYNRLINDAILSVYRREYDGRFVLIQDGIPNDRSITITDPHPALDYARYRIVAMSKTTGIIGYYDMPDVPIKETGIVIQWGEHWESFIREYDSPDQREEETWSGTVLRLPYNVSISDDYEMDTNLVEYIGRSHPVSYYGTQLGVSGSWSTDVPRDDTETIFALRRLAIYTGNVYVREPSGVGYWAKINVSMSKNYKDMLIPVTLDVTRVEGGV